MPTAAPNAFDILLRFLVDAKTLDQVKRGTLSVNEALAGNEGALNALGIAALKLQPILEQQKRESGNLQAGWWQTQRVLRASAFVFQQFALAGTAAMAPFLLSLNTFIKDSQKAGAEISPVAQQWTASMDKIHQSTAKVGEATATVLLPYLEKLAALADRAASYIDKHPDIIKAFLATGAALLTVGTLGTLVTNGVKMYVDTKFTLAVLQQTVNAKMELEASKNNLLLAAALNKVGWSGAGQAAALGQLPGRAAKTFGSTALGKVAISVGTASLIIGSLFFGAEAGVAIGNWLGRLFYGESYKSGGLADAAKAGLRIYENSIGAIALLLRQAGLVTDEESHKIAAWIANMDSLINTTDEASSATEDLSHALAGSAHEAEIVKAYMKLVQEDQKAYTKYQEDSAKIAAKAARDSSKAIEKAASASRAADDKYTSSVRKIYTDFRNSEVQAEERQATERSKLLRDSSTEILKIEQDNRDELKRLAQEHSDRMAEAINLRNALDIYNEQIRYDREKERAIEETNKEIVQRRKDLKVKLQDMAAEAKAEAAQRRQDLAQKLAEAAQQRNEEKKRAQQELRERLQEIAQNAAQEQIELANNYNRERMQRREAFIEQVRDLDAALIGETELKRQRYQQMLADAQAFMDRYRATMNPNTAIPTHDYTGYATKGLYYMAANGQREFVLGGDATRAAESAVSGRLTKENVMGLISGGRNTVVYQDHRVFSADVPLSVRREIADETADRILTRLRRGK